MVLGIKNIYDMEGMISTKELCLHFLNRSIPLSPKTDVILKPGEALFIGELSVLAKVKLLD